MNFWTEIVALLFFFGAMALIGTEDRGSSEVTQKIVAESPRPITHYTITQDSKGLRHEYELNPLPLSHPLPSLEDK